MFATKESVLAALKDLAAKLEADEIKVVNAATEGDIWVDDECVRFTISLSFLSNMEEDEDGEEEECADTECDCG